MPVTKATIVSLIEPLTGVGLAWVLFGERLGPSGLLGAALLLIAMAMIFRGARARGSLRRAAPGEAPAGLGGRDLHRASKADWPAAKGNRSTASSGTTAAPDVTTLRPVQPSRIHTVPAGTRAVTWAWAPNSPAR
jgi:hypothetical protein